MPYKDFQAAQVLTATEVDQYLMNQSVMVFASSTARASAITAPTQGMVTYLTDSKTFWFYNGTAWQQYGNVMVFASSTARSTAIPSPTEGMVTYLQDVDELEVYTGASWARLAKTSDDDNITTTGSITAQSGGVDGGLVMRSWPVNPSSFMSIQTGNMGSSEYVLITNGDNVSLGSGANGDTYINGRLGSTTHRLAILTTTARFNGRLNIDAQPAVYAYNSAGLALADNNVLRFDAAVVNRGSHYNTSTSTFTCPIAGLYFVICRVLTNNNTDGTDIRIAKNGSRIEAYAGYSVVAGVLNSHKQGHVHGIVDCAANDTLQIRSVGSFTEYGAGAGHTALSIWMVA